LYPDEYPFPSPNPSPRAMAAPPLVPDTGLTPHTSDDSDQGLSTPPELASQTPTPPSHSRRGTSYPLHTGSQLFIEAPGHPPIPGFFAITNALNGLDMNGGGTDCMGLTTPKKLKAKKSKSTLPGEANGTSTAKRARVVSPSAPCWNSDVPALGGF